MLKEEPFNVGDRVYFCTKSAINAGRREVHKEQYPGTVIEVSQHLDERVDRSYYYGYRIDFDYFTTHWYFNLPGVENVHPLFEFSKEPDWRI